MAKKNGGFPVFGLIYSIVAIPYNFFIGFVVGVAAPVAAIAAMVLGVRFLTGKMPFLKLSDDEERRLSLELVEEEQAQELFEVEKEKVMAELGGFAEEMKALMEEAKATVEEIEEAEEA
ncbi:MAG: hypothetical protein GWN58_64755 [Anaerolineae bacterium]|nr:hypothetical protein [Anaerolineae bacterium]